MWRYKRLVAGGCDSIAWIFSHPQVAFLYFLVYRGIRWAFKDLSNGANKYIKIFFWQLLVLKYVQNKDVFMRYHKAHLTRRLILDISADSEIEENMVEWLRVSSLLSFFTCLFLLRVVLILTLKLLNSHSLLQQVLF